MGEMKTDKTGACTVLNAIATAAQLAPDLPLLAVAPAVENMPGPHSTRPGDVVRAMNGKTVEINNTDAEGRLILGDALTWTERQGATHVVDVATLTGAMARALGPLHDRRLRHVDEWWAEVAAAAARQGEPLWRMPMLKDLRKDIDSPFADMSNVGSGEGGAITAALFLSEFIDLPWVHLDIAGSAFLSKTEPFSTKGSTGVMHATLVDLALAGVEEPMSLARERGTQPSSASWITAATTPAAIERRAEGHGRLEREAAAEHQHEHDRRRRRWCPRGSRRTAASRRTSGPGSRPA